MELYKNKQILVLGGAGFIGSHLCDALLKHGTKKVICLDNFFLGKEINIQGAIEHNNFVLYRDDARHLGAVQAIIEKEKVDVVYNMATIALNYSFFNPYDAYMANIEITNNLLILLKQGLFKSLIHTSSSEAYGTAQYSPMDENHPMKPTTPYAAGKASADMMLQSFSATFGLDVRIIRPFNNYGPRQNAEGSLAAIIPATVRRIQMGKHPIVEGDGEQTRDFIYVEDTVKGLLLAYEKEESKGEIINLGSGNEISINKLLKGICSYMDYHGEWEHRSARSSDVRRLCASAKKAREILGFKLSVEFDEGIKRTLDWYRMQK